MRKTVIVIFYVALLSTLHSTAQLFASAADSLRWESTRRVIQQSTQEDYANMLNQLHITSTRPGPSGNP